VETRWRPPQPQRRHKKVRGRRNLQKQWADILFCLCFLSNSIPSSLLVVDWLIGFDNNFDCFLLLFAFIVYTVICSCVFFVAIPFSARASNSFNCLLFFICHF
jgi:hypothetical protein